VENGTGERVDAGRTESRGPRQPTTTAATADTARSMLTTSDDEKPDGIRDEADDEVMDKPFR
jgi:hypothetical protein